ncbi:MAG: hypothetical protein GY803_12925 [Chloroflexi bacterium]|nr:hypothetical protein [Chloroflexota bacterium]
MALDVSFHYDYDSDLYMLSKDPRAKNWTVIVHCKDGRSHTPALVKFTPYPGCETHEGEAAWLVDYYGAEKVEIKRPLRKSVFATHPDLGF